MPHYVDDPDHPGNVISVIELQKRRPCVVLPPVFISDWLKKDLWTRKEAVQLLAGVVPSENGLLLSSPHVHLDGTSDQTLLYGDTVPKGWPDNTDQAGDYPRLTHPLRDEIAQNLLTLKNWVKHCDLNETQPPKVWIDWAGEKDFKPYWLEYAETIQSAPAAKGKVATPGDDWTEKARAITDRLALEKYNRGEREITARNICDAVAIELAKDSTTHGIRGQRSAGNIRNEALKGWKFIPPTGTNGTSGTKK